MIMNSINYSCYDREGLSNDSVTSAYWQSRGTSYEGPAIATTIVVLFYCLVGIPSNLLIIVSIVWQKLFKQPTYVLLLNLAIVDLLLCGVSMPSIIVVGFARGLIFGSTDIIRCRLCQIYVTSFTLFINLTVFLLGAISIDRLIFMKWAIKYYTTVSAKYYALTCVGLWIYSLVLALFPFFGFGDVVYRPELSSCSLKYVGETTVTRNLYYPVLLVLQGLVPLAFILVTSIWLLCIVLKQMKKMSWKNESQEYKNEYTNKLKKIRIPTNMKQLRLIKVFGAIWMANLVAWAPYIIRVFVTLFFGNIWPDSFYVFSYTSLLVSAVIFPIIEASIIPELRAILVTFLKRILCCKSKCNCCHLHKSDDLSKGTTAGICRCLDFINVSFIPSTELSSMQNDG